MRISSPCKWEVLVNNNNPKEISFKSKTRVFWKCHICGGAWNTQAKERRGCPYCTGFKALAGFNDLTTTNPELVSEWDYDLNKELIPENVTKGSAKIVFWKCKRGHSWQAHISSRTKGEGCPYCANRKVLSGFNDLSTINPSLALEWDYKKNAQLTPSQILAGAKQKVWWICKEGHSWQAPVGSRNSGLGCPVCSNRFIVENQNDFASVHPELLSEWDYEKNEYAPSTYSGGSRQTVWWTCKKGHSWQAAIGERSRGCGCPKCSEERRVSFPEKAILYYASKAFPGVIGNYRSDWLKPYELDIYFPDYHLGIEYDGIYGHSKKQGIERDVRKNNKCFNHNVTLVRIREYGCPSTNSTSLDYILDEKDTLKDAVSFSLRIITEITGEKSKLQDDQIDIEKDSGAIYSLVDYTEKENSLAEKAPNIASLWHPTKNGKLTPEYVSFMSSKKVWWMGLCGHEWMSTIAYEVTSGRCPYCSGKRVLKGYNDLVSTNSELIKEWDYRKNTIYPDDLTSGSGKKVWWVCKRNHSWKASIVSRNRGNGCPICSNRIVVKGYNDIASFPKLLLDWDYRKNKQLPEEICIGSNKKYFWKCHICNFEWLSSASNRNRGQGCPNCAKALRSSTSRNTYIARSGSLMEKRPDLIHEWDYEKNKDLDPSKVTSGSDKKAWWVCSKCGYSWNSLIRTRTRKNGGSCPQCANRLRTLKRQERVLEQKPPISITHPDIAKEFSVEKNTSYPLEMVTSGSGRRLWWKCSKCGYEWQAQVCERTRGRSKCPQCQS